jgi:RNA polymerase sigma-70 factor (ECF subfamily)
MNILTLMEEFLKELEKHRHELYRFVVRTVWDTGVAEDVFSSAVTSAWENWHKFTPGTNFRAWMYRIITNKCYVANRVTKRRPLPLPDESEGGWAPLQEDRGYQSILDDSDDFLEQCGDEVHRAFKELSTAQRMCLLLKSVEKFSYREIAETMEIPLGTVMTHLARGRAKLRTSLLEYARDEGIVKKVPNIVPLRESAKNEGLARGLAREGGDRI